MSDIGIRPTMSMAVDSDHLKDLTIEWQSRRIKELEAVVADNKRIADKMLEIIERMKND